MITHRDEILNEIHDEREYQQNVKEYDDSFDDKHNIDNWNNFINRYLSKAAWTGASKEVQRLALLKAVAIGVAALEAFDRNDGFPGRHFDPK